MDTVEELELDTSRSVFVLNMDANGLGVARSLGWNGIRVIGVDYRPSIPGLFSKYVEPLLTPDPVSEPEATVEALLKASRNADQKPVIMACSDAYVLLVSRYRHELGKNFVFAVPPEDITECILNKQRQYELARKAGIPIPRTIFPKSMAELEHDMQEITFPAFVKPFYSHVWYRVFGNKGFIVNNKQELRARMSRVFNSSLQAMVQSIVLPPGKDLYQYCAYVGKEGQIFPSFVWIKARQAPPNFGVASLAISRKNHHVQELGERFLRSISYKGIGSVEFKFDPERKEYVLIELNCRTWMQNVMSTIAGINLPLYQYADLTNQNIPCNHVFKEGIRWWDSISDIDSFIRLRRREEINTVNWLKSWLGSDCYAYFWKDDIRPALRRAGFGIEIIKALVNAMRMEFDEDSVG
ncbi:MAG: hypothetical protein QW520_05065 [Methanomassiliicoccales archaeon]